MIFSGKHVVASELLAIIKNKPFNPVYRDTLLSELSDFHNSKQAAVCLLHISINYVYKLFVSKLSRV